MRSIRNRFIVNDVNSVIIEMIFMMVAIDVSLRIVALGVTLAASVGEVSAYRDKLTI